MLLASDESLTCNSERYVVDNVPKILKYGDFTVNKEVGKFIHQLYTMDKYIYQYISWLSFCIFYIDTCAGKNLLTLAIV